VAQLLDSRVGHATSLLLVRLLCLVGESAATPCDAVALKQVALTATLPLALPRTVPAPSPTPIND
jgi:hypothetical protein